MEKQRKIPTPLLVTTAVFWGILPMVLTLISYAGHHYSFRYYISSFFERGFPGLDIWFITILLYLYIPLIFICVPTALAVSVLGGQKAGSAIYAVYPFSLIYTAAYLVLLFNTGITYVGELGSIILIPLCTLLLFALLRLSLKVNTLKSVIISVIFMVLFAISAAASCLGGWLFGALMSV